MEKSKAEMMLEKVANGLDLPSRIRWSAKDVPHLLVYTSIYTFSVCYYCKKKAFKVFWPWPEKDQTSAELKTYKDVTNIFEIEGRMVGDKKVPNNWPVCAFCKTLAVVNCKTKKGEWSNLCESCFSEEAIDIGDGLGFILVKEVELDLKGDDLDSLRKLIGILTASNLLGADYNVVELQGTLEATIAADAAEEENNGV